MIFLRFSRFIFPIQNSAFETFSYYKVFISKFSLVGERKTETFRLLEKLIGKLHLLEYSSKINVFVNL